MGKLDNYETSQLALEIFPRRRREVNALNLEKLKANQRGEIFIICPLFCQGLSLAFDFSMSKDFPISKELPRVNFVGCVM